MGSQSGAVRGWVGGEDYLGRSTRELWSDGNVPDLDGGSDGMG